MLLPPRRTLPGNGHRHVDPIGLNKENVVYR
jgi:hypothetical protein